MQTGTFIIVDGIDGSGKGTIADALAAREASRGARVFDLREFAKQQHRLPEVAELTGYDLVLSAEPTHAWIGRTIREEIIRANDRTYGALRTAELFAMDRLVLYRRVLLPALAHGLHVVQERSVTSSLVYQPIQAEPVDLATLSTLEGNAFALAHPPTLCIIVSTEPPRALQRLQLRTGKQDAAIFERLPVLQQLHERYHSTWFRELLTAHRWQLTHIDANAAVEDSVALACAAWDRAVAPIAALA
ncbi:hypothetical protein HY632_02560 [Candidatus Uhrbacteria bacterium]|nr:hypothetical protein [Candidatus Uhrbacteria bacterium]